MTAAWRLRRRIDFPVLTPVLVLVLIYYAERELRDYAEQGIANAFDRPMSNRAVRHAGRARSFIATGCVGLLAAAPVAGQAAAGAAPAGDAATAGGILVVGETMEFGVQFGPIQLGSNQLTVAARETINGEDVYRLEEDFQAPIPFFRIHDRQTSWVMLAPFRSIRFDRFIREGRKRTSWRVHLDGPDRRLRAEHLDGQVADPAAPDDSDPPPEVMLPEAPLDDLAVLWEMRRRISVGETSFTIDRYYLAEHSPAVFELERRDRTRVPAGRFDVYVLKAVVPGMSMFKPESDARIHVAVDPPHPIVMVTTEAEPGRLTLYLRDFRPGDTSEDTGVTGPAAPPPR